MANKLTAENIEAAAQHLENIQDRYRHLFLARHKKKRIK